MLPRRQKFFKAVIWAYFEQTECRGMHIVAGRSIRAKVVIQPDANELQEPECSARSGSPGWCPASLRKMRARPTTVLAACLRKRNPVHGAGDAVAVVEPDSEPRFSQHELVPRSKANPERPRRNRHGAAVANHARAVRAPIVAQAIPSGGRLVGEMGVPAGHALVDLSRSFDERHLVRPYEAVARVPDLGAASEVDALGGKRVGFSFRRAAHDGQVDAGECRFARRFFRRRSRDTSKGESELRMSPVLWRLGHVGDVQRQVVNRSTTSTEDARRFGPATGARRQERLRSGHVPHATAPERRA